MKKHRLFVPLRFGLCLFAGWFLMLYLWPVTSFSQAPATGKITGKIRDEKGEPLIAASIKIDGTNIGGQSDVNGAFSLNAAPGTYTLVVTYISYQVKKVPKVVVTAGKTTAVNVSMEPESGTLNEVVVVGYGTQKKENLTGAVDQVTSKVINNRPLPNLSQGLQGVLPSLNITPQDGKPTQSPRFNIRGTTSVGQGGSALVLVDGVEGDPSRINPNDIATVSILKDAASASIYGARGAFGVVLITTKNPQKDRTSINYTFNQAIRNPTTIPDLVTNGYQFAQMFNDSWAAWNDYSQTPQNINKTIKFSQDYLAELKRRDANPDLPKVEVGPDGQYVYYANTDWFHELYRKNSLTSDHNLSLSGNSGKADFLITGRYYNQSGIFRYNSDDYSVYNIRAKGSLQVYPWLRIYNNADYSNLQYHNPLNVGEGGSIWRNLADEGHTNAPMLNPDGTLTFSGAYTVGDFYYGKNGINTNNRVFRNTAGFATNFFNDQFRIKGDYTFQNTDNADTRIRVPVPYSPAPGVIMYVGTATNDLQNRDQGTQYIATNTYAEYEPKLKSENHYVKALIGFNYEQSTFKNLTLLRNGLISPTATDINLALGQSIATTGGYEQWAILGGFYRLNYSYKNRYLFEFNGRYDGSSKFPANQRFGFFPSVSAGWRVSQEPFWKVSPKIISDLKIRASYGSLGNGSIGSYAFQQQFSIRQSALVLNGVRPQYTTQPGVLPDGLTWETARSQNLGLDLSLLSSRLTITGDAYIRKTINMFTQGLPLPAVFGTSVPNGNYADMKTVGWEATLAWRDRFDLGKKAFGYGIRLNMADYQSTITKFNNPQMRISNNSVFSSPDVYTGAKNTDGSRDNNYYVGQKVGEIWGYVTDGFFTSQAQINSSASQALIKSSNGNKLLPGDIKFADLNGDGVINTGDNTVTNPGDRRVIGNATPRYTYGIGLDADYCNFFISAFFQGVGKQDWYPGPESDYFWGQYNRPYNKVPTWQLGNIWSESNPDAYLPRYRGYTAQNGAAELTQTQTRYLQNIAYIRMKNIQVGYNLPSSFINRIKMSSARIYLSGENLFTWSPLYRHTRDLDVESVYGSDRVLTDGTAGNGNNYPILKSVTMGLSVTF